SAGANRGARGPVRDGVDGEAAAARASRSRGVEGRGSTSSRKVEGRRSKADERVEGRGSKRKTADSKPRFNSILKVDSTLQPSTLSLRLHPSASPHPLPYGRAMPGACRRSTDARTSGGGDRTAQSGALVPQAADRFRRGGEDPLLPRRRSQSLREPARGAAGCLEEGQGPVAG